ncbi:MAG: DUF3488 and transglutaminase-like domain-containing protein [Acidimicrobiales bacterium]
MEQGDETMNRQVLLGQVSAAGLLLVIAATFYGRVFNGAGWVGPIVGAVIISGTMAVGLGRTRMGRTMRSGALFFSGLLFLLLAVVLPTTNFGSIDQITNALTGSTIDGWRNALAATLPIDTAIPEPLGFVTILAWLAGSVTGSLVARSRNSAPPIIPAVAFAAMSLPLAAPTGLVTYLLIAALVASALLLTLVGAVPERGSDESTIATRVTEFSGDRLLTERLVAGAPVLLVLGLAAPLLAAFVPTAADEPFDPRRLRVEEVEFTAAVNPLAELKSKRQDSTRAFLLEIPAAPAASLFDRVGLVALDTYNGANWTTDATYSAAPIDLSPAEVTTVETLEVRQRIEITDPSLPWIPVGQPAIRINAEDVWFDERSGTLLSPEGPRALSYEVVSRIPVPSDDQLRAASIDLSDPRYIDLPSISPDSAIVNLGGRLVGETDYDRLLALETALRDEWTLVLEESSGTSIGRLDEFMLEQQGYRDQFVAAFAVAARQQGFPTRIMVGYRIVEDTDDNRTVFLDTITSAQYDAWPEVRFEGIGWVNFDPVPRTSGEGTLGRDDATQIPEGQPVTQGPTPREADAEEDDTVEEDDSGPTATARAVVVVGLFLVIFPLALIFLVLLAKMLRRRWRENLDDPTARVLAGWQESKDRLLEAGVEIRPDMTVKEIVAASRRDLGVHASSSLASLAPHVTATIYARQGPGTDTANIVWDEMYLFDRQLGESRSTFQTVKARVDPRPLLESV